ncbi:pullulanase-type alpha-1,6-glucosidase [Streptomyces sp. NPDC053499]|uniref:pullulanase-type alpha-1,6-glucosidase n=1 Tax=Streptomyces sp. NPDC053499 TaxID=3365707 RepID=UPI0037CFE061
MKARTPRLRTFRSLRTLRSRALVAALTLSACATTALGAAPGAALTPGTSAPGTAASDGGEATDLSTARVQWIDRTTVAWPRNLGDHTAPHRLVTDREGDLAVRDGKLTGGGRELPLERVPGGLSDRQRAKWPHLSGAYDAYRVSEHDPGALRGALRGQVVATAGEDRLSAATGVQLPGVLDDLYADEGGAEHARLGPAFHQGRRTSLALWAPTAQRVRLLVGGRAVPMHRDEASGVWRATGNWRDVRYRYRVTVWSPSAGKVVTNDVTDPYSTALTADSRQSVATDLSDPRLAPPGWSRLRKPRPTALRNAQIQELHIRDFSRDDRTVAARERGTYRAFTERNSDGMRHLRKLASAGTSHVHLLPAFDFSSVPERRTDRQQPQCELAKLPPDSAEQQQCVRETAGRDGFNWGYDPQHYTVPEGSYAARPDGPSRTREFRDMVRGLNRAGLRTVMDVVYNHTTAAGQDPRSVLDRVVPGYYHRLDADGRVATSTCCANTAPEHTMMGKLVVDSVVTWARQYKVDGFRFDLMGHHPKANILAVRRALDALTPARDGVDGKHILLYGEGWNFGEVADDARFTQATQRNMAGTGVATFSDRARDAIRGGGPFDEDPRVQGFASGLATDPNPSPANGSPAQQRARLLHYQDLIKVGLSGNLAGYRFTDSRGRSVTGAEVDYNGAPAGYARRPGDALAYADAHDNETLYDALAFKLPAGTTAADRARMQVLGMATATLSQGPSLSHAGSDLLRSKSLDRNSYDSGDWFNALHWDCRRGNGFGRGLPPAPDNEAKWPYAKPLLTNPKLYPDCARITATAAAYRDLLRIRTTEPAFGKKTAAEVQRSLSFPLSGPAAGEKPGVITARLDDLVLVFNATPQRRTQRVPALVGRGYALHPLQGAGADPVVRRSGYEKATGTFTVPGRTVAVFRQRP